MELKHLKLILRPDVLRETFRFLVKAGDAFDDSKLTADERDDLMRQAWVVIKTYQRQRES